MKAIEIEQLCFRVNGKEILDSINLTLDEGKFLGIIGPNGSGKSTLLRILLGILKPSTGGVKIFGQSPEQAVRQGVFGYLPQTQKIEMDFPARAIDVVLLGLYKQMGPFRWASAKGIQRAQGLLTLMGMEDFADQPFGSLSGGEQQRVSIARALIHDPKILILDEPSTGIDVVGQEDFYHLLRGLQKKYSLTIIMVSHDIGTVTSYVDEIACLNKTLHCHGSPSVILNEEVLKTLFGKGVDFIVHTAECEKCERLQHGGKPEYPG
ncbi:MAG: metal ABC transporter ATP-binding protein [Deltaproteobacteria bacterium]|nr:metal ABC transporter ATP-binding protein [Deltaproteobacteria bacterium]